MQFNNLQITKNLLVCSSFEQGKVIKMRIYLRSRDKAILLGVAFTCASVSGGLSLLLSRSLEDYTLQQKFGDVRTAAPEMVLAARDDYKTVAIQDAAMTAGIYGVMIPLVLGALLARERRNDALLAAHRPVPVPMPVKLGRAFAGAVRNRLPRRKAPRSVRRVEEEHYPYPWQARPAT